MHNYFVRIQGKNSNFYHTLDLDDKLRVRNVFWVDVRSRAAYEFFHDVITFDTTYLTNNYNMSFAHFIGINHYGESIIFGVGYYPVKTRIRLYEYLDNGCKVCVALLQKSLSHNIWLATNMGLVSLYKQTK